MPHVVHQRAGAFESSHPVSAVMCDASGALIEQLGPALVTTWRSAAKPFQLEVSLELSAADISPPSAEELAIGAASHTGEEPHLRAVREVLRRYGCGEDSLRCGAHWPIHEPSAHALVRLGERPRAIHNNCSGKHAFMAGATHSRGLDPDYRAFDHPLQRRLLERLTEHTDGGVEERVVDGCGVPCFVLSLRAMATAWARLAREVHGGGSTLAEVGRAMLSHPHLVSGTGRLDAHLATAATAPLIT